MVIVICKITEDHEMELFKQLLQFIADSFPKSLLSYTIINNKCNDTINDLDVHVFKGKDHMFEEMEGLRFKVGPKSFYQTNSEQAYNLYKIAAEFAGLTGKGTGIRPIYRNGNHCQFCIPPGPSGDWYRVCTGSYRRRKGKCRD